MSESKGKILVVEDSADEANLIKMILEPEGYEVAVASNGEEGLKKVASDRPDLIVLDVMMPELDGFTMCSKLRESPEHGSTPVILLTGVAKRISDSKYPLDGVLRADAEQYLEKPVKPEELLETVARLLK
jgi:two-component system alkaline phosphatase synthesis response regulator PhoP